MPEQDVKSPQSSHWLSILEQKGRGDQRLAVDERRFEEHRLWQASLKRRDDAIAKLEIIRSEEMEYREIEPLPEPIPILGELDDEEVRYAGEIGRWIPQFEYYSPFRQRIAKAMSRGILFLTGFISVHQRRYNHLVLDKLTATQERLDELIEAVNTLSEHLGAIEGLPPGVQPEDDDLTDDEDSMDREARADGNDSVDIQDSEDLVDGEQASLDGDSDEPFGDRLSPSAAGLDALRAEVHRLQCQVLSQTVELADLQAERLGRNLKQLDEL